MTERKKAGRPSGPQMIGTTDPILRQIFQRQIALKMKDHELAKAAMMTRLQVMYLRCPNTSHGKIVKLGDVRKLAKAVGFRFPDRLLLECSVKEGSDNDGDQSISAEGNGRSVFHRTKLGPTFGVQERPAVRRSGKSFSESAEG